MTGRGSRRKTARLLCAAALAGLAASPALAQTATAAQHDPTELDPSAPLDAMPGMEVDWPTLDQSADEPQAPVAGQAASSDNAVREAGGELRYTLSIEGLGALGDAAALLGAFHKSSTLDAGRRKPANAAQITRRARADADLLAELLRSHGYYDAVVEPRTEVGTGAAAGVIQVVLEAQPGVEYRFASVELPGLEAAGPDAAELRKLFAVNPGDPVVAQDVIDAGTALTHALGERGFAEAKVGERQIELNHQTHLATLILPVDPGPVASFGAIRVIGDPPFGARDLATIARFKRGDRFERSKVDDLRRALIATGLIAAADIQVVPVDGGRTVDLAVRLEPAPTRTIAGEVGYGTGQGARVEASWTNRNFFNPEGALTLRGVVGTSEQLAAVQLRRSNFRRRDQILNLQALAANQHFDAYEAKTVSLSGNIERQSNFIWHKKWTWSYGAELLATDEQGVYGPGGIEQTRTFLIAAAPLILGYDDSDSLLDPTRGFRLTGRLAPEISAHGGRFTYARTQIDASAYRPVSERVVAAGRIRVGTIIGAGVYDIAPSRRFYSGGGGSVRGYGYQQLGPKDIEGDPIGGRGLAEFALEARIRLDRFGGNFGVVPFLDGGSLTTNLLPSFKDWRFAAGLGLRYYSSFGPIRIDVSVPLNRQKGDGLVAVAVSLGQAF